MNISIESHLQTFLERQGEEAWRIEVQRLAIAALRTGSEKHEAFWRGLTKDYSWLDWEELKRQAQPGAPSTDRLIAETLRSQMPGIKSQAQYDAAIGALQAVRLVVNSLLTTTTRQEQREARAAFDVALDAVRKATELTLKLEDSPEAATSAAAQQFKGAPAQFLEAEVQAQLLQELTTISTIDTLNEWYVATKNERDKLVTHDLRNVLLDEIRATRNALVGAG